MPFVAVCPKHGVVAEGDCTQNGHLLNERPVRHLEIDECGRVVCMEQLEFETVDLQGRSAHIPFIDPKERAVVWKHPVTGKVVYPGRNDRPMPVRYRERGYERVEVGASLREVEKFEKEHNVRSEAAWFNRGSGRGFDD